MLTQDRVNRVWSTEWKKGGIAAKAIFTQRLFVEGYPVFKKYIPKDPKRFLDVGAGSGRYGLKFAEEFPGAHVTITDVLDESVAMIAGFAKELSATNVTVAKEDIFSLSFAEETFDVVFCDVVIQHLSDVENAMREMRRVLKPGGVLIVSVNNKWNPHTIYKFFAGKSYHYGYEKSYTQGELRELFVRCDFRIIALDGFYPAYSIYRLKRYWKPAALIGKILNRVNRLIDPWTGRFLSRHFGFEIFCVGRKQ